MYKVPHSPPLGAGEDYQILWGRISRRGEGNLRAFWKNITWKKRVRGSNIICFIILRLHGRLSSGEEGKGTEILVKKIKFF